MTFLELCQAFVAEIGIGGGTGPDSVVAQEGEFASVVRWIRDSNLWVDNLWKDWNYLWFEYSGVLGSQAEPQLNRFAPPPNNPIGLRVREWDRESFWIDKQGNRGQPLRWIDWKDYRQIYDVGRDGLRTGKPRIITAQPNGQLIVNPIPNGNYIITGEGWRRPEPLMLDNDTPLMPKEYHRIIIARAAIMYANKEDAPEIISGMEAEYIDLLDKLQSDQLDGFKEDRKSTQDLLLVGNIPG